MSGYETLSQRAYKDGYSAGFKDGVLATAEVLKMLGWTPPKEDAERSETDGSG